MIIRSQIANGLMAVIIFYFIPAFSVTPKTNLFIYLLLSTLFIILWRLDVYSILSLRRKYPASVIGSGQETDELVHEMDNSPRIGLYCKEKIKPEGISDGFIRKMEDNGDGLHFLVADLDDPRVEAAMPELYRRLFSRVQIIDLHSLYEDAFDRVPLSRMDHAWIMANVSSLTSRIYDIAKRAIDIILGIAVGIVACAAYPFVALAVKIDDGGPVFISQERIGKGGKSFRYYKFRSMQRNENGKWLTESDNKVTRVGMFLRKTRLDEFPQALAVLKGDMSLIGPRADIVGLYERLEKEIPYYAVRTVIKPGLTGWAQINQGKPPQSIEENKIRLSYDLFYITRRSIGLDIRIALRTVKTLLSRAGM